MIVQIKLSEDGPPFYFLGDPKRLTVSLTYHEPGPVPLDFSKLGHAEQQKVLIDIQREAIEVDVPFHELQQEYEKFFPANTPATPQRVTAPGEKIDKGLKLEAEREKKEAKFQARCKLLTKQGPNALRSSLKDETDLRLLRTLRDLELAKKKVRSGVLEFLDMKLRKLQANLVEEIEKSATLEIEAGLPPQVKETIVYDVIESEKETVTLTPELLAQFANGVPLGGE